MKAFKVLGCPITDPQMAELKKLIREKAVQEDRDLSLSQAIREGLAAIGLQIKGFNID